jgi:hypothetical protein
VRFPYSFWIEYVVELWGLVLTVARVVVLSLGGLSSSEVDRRDYVGVGAIFRVYLVWLLLRTLLVFYHFGIGLIVCSWIEPGFGLECSPEGILFFVGSTCGNVIRCGLDPLSLHIDNVFDVRLVSGFVCLL